MVGITLSSEQIRAAPPQLRSVRGDAEVILCAVDRQGNRTVAEKTAANILALWHDIVAERALQPAPPSPAAAEPVPAFRMAAAPDIPPLAAEPG